MAKPERSVVLVCGSRTWDDEKAVERQIRKLPDNTVVVTGGAPGADQIAERVANARGLHVAVVEPLWGRFGKSAGHKRNYAMLDLNPTLVLAFTHGSPGTAGTIKEAQRRGILVEVFGSGAEAP